jgi:hypothetical protein
MNRFPIRSSVLVAVFALAAAGCSSSSKSPAASKAPAASSSSSSMESPGAAIPSAKTIARPVVYGYYDGHVDTMLSTDVTSKTQASSQHINYSAALALQPAGKFPALYMVSGRAAPNQPVVFSTEPGESDYTPLWDETTVRWKPGATPVLLVRDDQIKALAAQGKLTIHSTGVILNCPIVKVS